MNPTPTVPEVILMLLGGPRFVLMTGARDFIGEGNTLSFKIRGVSPVNYVRITLEADYTYTMKFYRTHALQLDHLATAYHVYADNLRACFTHHTGLNCT